MKITVRAPWWLWSAFCVVVGVCCFFASREPPAAQESTEVIFVEGATIEALPSGAIVYWLEDTGE